MSSHYLKSATQSVNLSLYVIVDRAFGSYEELLKKAELAIAGGATMIQYRDKVSDIKTFVETARKLHDMTQKANLPLIINDRVDVVVAVDVDGVHVGMSDIPIYLTRRMLGKRKIIGASVKTSKQALQAQRDGADYIGAGPVFATKSKSDAGEPIGLNKLTAIVRSVRIPVVAIGGITASNAKAVMETGVAGVAVISAVMGAGDPERATRELYEQIQSTKHKIQNKFK